MKKVLSVALASAMVLGMGANAFAIQYNSGSNDKADWPENFKFDGSLFVTDKDGDIVTDATTSLNDNEDVDFQPGDVIWMPLYADDQLVWDANVNEGTEDKIGVNNIKIVEEDHFVDATGKVIKTEKKNGKWTKDYSAAWTGNDCVAYHEDGTAYYYGQLQNAPDGKYTFVKTGEAAKFTAPTEVEVKGEKREISTIKVTVNGRTFTGKPETVEEKVNEYLADVTAKEKDQEYYKSISFSGTANVEAKDGEDTTVDKPHVDNTTDGVTTEYGHYTGNIDKNWSINLIEKSSGVADLVEKAELYKATKNDYASYKDYTTEIMPNAVYLKITLKKEWKTVSDETLKYYVYIANNKNSSDKTNEVWVSGKYAPTTREVNFTWTNEANEPALWEAKESGVAVFDFADKAFFTVKMYKGETMFLDLETAYDKAIAGEMDADADSFYKFDKSNSSFSRAGELVIVSDDETLVPYEIDEDGNFVAVDAEYVKDYAIAHTNSKVNGFVFNTKQLGNYVLSTEELGEVEDEAPVEDGTDADENTVTPEPETPVQTEKPNPNTGANDFVGLAVSLAVVSVAAAGALALKK